MSLKLLVVGDIHLRAIKPVSRLDEDFLGTTIGKIDQIREMSSGFDLVILLGDVFDRPDASHSVVLRAIRAFGQFKAPVYSIVGNHDVMGYQGQTLDKTALGVLFESGVLKKLDSLHIGNVGIYGVHAYDKNIWTVPEGSKTKVLVAHKMITNNPFPGGECILVKDMAAETNADIILSGDIHYPHEVEIGTKLFVNPGSLMRLNISDRDRHPQVAQITIENSGEVNCNLAVLNVRPSETVFDLENYSNRMASEMHTKDFAKTYAQAVISVKGEAHKIAEILEKFLSQNGVESNLHTSVMEYYGRAEKEILEEIKD